MAMMSCRRSGNRSPSSCQRRLYCEVAAAVDCPSRSRTALNGVGTQTASALLAAAGDNPEWLRCDQIVEEGFRFRALG
jgi:hypothetical protein